MKHKNEINLSGRWRFRTDPDELGEHFREQLDAPWRFDARWMDLTYDDGEWAEINVPSNWQAEGYDYNGAAWYRREVTQPIAENERMWLRFQGVDYFADVWFNDRYLGSHEGYFAAFQYEITPYLQPERNLLAVRVDAPNDICAKERQTWQFKSQMKGALQRWDVNNPELNPGGIWNDVKLIQTGPGTILGLRVHSQILRLPDRPDEPAPIIAAVEADLAGFPPTLSAGKAQLRIRLTPANFEGADAETVLPIETFAESCTWQAVLRLEEARLWYTWDTGTPCVYEVSVSLELDGVLSDEISQTCGFRKIERRDGWAVYLNGVRLFQRGANYLSDQCLSSMTPERYRQDVELLKEANLNTVHPFAVVEKQAFYDLCDQYGLLVYQDFPIWLEASNASDLVRRAQNQLRELIAQFGRHPSICIWNFGSQPSVANFTKLCSALASDARELDPVRIIHQANAIIDPTGKRYDPIGDFYWKEEMVEDFQKRFDWRVDTHQYFGWYYSKHLEDLASVPEEYLQLVTEYGAQALPARSMLEKIIPPDKLFPPVWPYYTRRCFQPEHQFDYIEQPESLEQMIEDSQAYQARFIQHHTEYYRLHKFKPCNGAHLFCFNDCWPAITWSVVDYDRERKEGFFALQRAMAPLQLFLELPGEPGAKPALWLVNDFPRQFLDLMATWTIKDSRSGDVLSSGEAPCSTEENTVNRVGELAWRPGSNDEVIIELVLSQGEETLARNRYRLP